MDSLRRISVLLEIKFNKEIREKLEILKKETEKEYKKLKDKDKYIELLQKEKNKVDKKIKDIKDTLDDDEKIKKEYDKRNRKLPLDKKIFSIRVLIKLLIEEKNEFIEKSKNLEENCKEENYNKALKETEEKLRYLRLIDIKDKENLTRELILIMQKIFLQGMNGRINQANTKEEIMDLIYQFRYYCMLPFDHEELTYQVKELHEDINSVGKFLLEKATAIKIISLFSKNTDLNYEILQNIYKTRIISLEELNIKITKEKEKFYIQLFDENIFDKKIEIESNRKIIKKDFSIKLNKKIKVFI